MSEFSNALDYVHGVLCDLRSRGASLTVTRETLEALACVAPAVAEVVAPKAAMAPPAPTPVAPRAEIATPVAPPARKVAPPTPVPAVPVMPKLPTAVPAAFPPLPTTGGSNAERLAAFREKVLACEKCAHLVKSRTNVVFGTGNPDAELMFVGEAPGEDEDLQAEPFVGKAGQLLTKIITAMGYERSDVYIANVLKCRPDMPAGASGNRKPTPEEMKTCLEFLEEQISIIRPKALVALGATAMQGLLGLTDPMARLRGRWHEFRGIPLMATYHPAYLLRNQSLGEKRKVWEDMLLVLEKLGRPISEKQRGYFLSK